MFVNQTLTARTVGLVGGVLAGLALALTGLYLYLIILLYLYLTNPLMVLLYLLIYLTSFLIVKLYFLSKTGPSALFQTSSFIRRRMGSFLFFYQFIDLHWSIRYWRGANWGCARHWQRRLHRWKEAEAEAEGRKKKEQTAVQACQVKTFDFAMLVWSQLAAARRVGIKVVAFFVWKLVPFFNWLLAWIYIPVYTHMHIIYTSVYTCICMYIYTYAPL